MSTPSPDWQNVELITDTWAANNWDWELTSSYSNLAKKREYKARISKNGVYIYADGNTAPEAIINVQAKFTALMTGQGV